MNFNYYNTFIQVAADCPVYHGITPQTKKAGKTVPMIQYELLMENPYTYTQEELYYQVHIRHKEIPLEEAQARRDEIWNELYSKHHACLRACMLPKKYGWGLHFDTEGRIALYGMESKEYDQYAQSSDVKQLAAMRSSRK
ncbi:hypothetical protein E0485_03170 [Paenibacillus albiflavus]|uniref:Uncharacterized protein n=1 Tax=Paenibacillus albiflavus TaxID=2545760 RepID=A0A4R4EN94_9BACL|nr:DUF6157 family protein [Paenibacillus albiflavus]TCZ79885.1 hypothetical protein E0485_03170 [Paenibacillus albiflavus]